MNKAREIFRNTRPNLRTKYALKKADLVTFSFWVNEISAKKQALFDICGLMQYQKSSY